MASRIKHSLFEELLRYLSVGVVVVTVQFSTLSLLVEKAALNPTFSSAIAYMISTVLNYILQYHFTFRSKHRHFNAILRYLCVTGFSLGLNVLIFWTSNVVFGMWYLFSQMIALILVTAFNFLVGRHYTFG